MTERTSMVNDNDEAKSSLGQSTASTNGSSARCFITKTLGPVVILPMNERLRSSRSTEMINLTMASCLLWEDF